MSAHRTAPAAPGDVQGALRALGVEIERVEDGEIWARCPAHRARTGRADRHPSFSVHEEKGVFCCFSCGYKGAFPTLVADALGLEPLDAAAWTAQFGTLQRAKRILARRTSPPAASSAAEPSLERYVPPPPRALRERGIDQDAAARYGLLWDERDGAWILPIRDARGDLLGYQVKRGHYVRNRPRGVPKAAALFGLHALDGDTAILVESPLDCARLWTAGAPGAVASFGAAVSDQQVDLLVSRAERVIIALDNDEAGTVNALSVEKRLTGRVRAVLYLAYPADAGVKDVGDMSDAQIHTALELACSPLRRRMAAL